jgi:hypothetical protein
LIIVAALYSGDIYGQVITPPPFATLRGAVRDSATHRAPAETSACLWSAYRATEHRDPCRDLTEAGLFQVDSIYPGLYVLVVACRGIRVGRVLAVDTVELHAGESVFWYRSVQGTGCGDPREVRREYRTMSGHYTYGLEASQFTPCPDDAWFLPGDSLHYYPYDVRHAWLEATEAARKHRPEWPELESLPQTEHRTPIVFMRARGWVEGPGDYGHLGVSVFRFEVDSILAVRAPRPSDCSGPVR